MSGNNFAEVDLEADADEEFEDRIVEASAHLQNAGRAGLARPANFRQFMK
jgi:hypothetical protein